MLATRSSPNASNSRKTTSEEDGSEGSMTEDLLVSSVFPKNKGDLKEEDSDVEQCAFQKTELLQQKKKIEDKIQHYYHKGNETKLAELEKLRGAVQDSLERMDLQSKLKATREEDDRIEAEKREVRRQKKKLQAKMERCSKKQDDTTKLAKLKKESAAADARMEKLNLDEQVNQRMAKYLKRQAERKKATLPKEDLDHELLANSLSAGLDLHAVEQQLSRAKDLLNDSANLLGSSETDFLADHDVQLQQASQDDQSFASTINSIKAQKALAEQQERDHILAMKQKKLQKKSKKKKSQKDKKAKKDAGPSKKTTDSEPVPTVTSDVNNNTESLEAPAEATEAEVEADKAGETASSAVLNIVDTKVEESTPTTEYQPSYSAEVEVKVAVAVAVAVEPEEEEEEEAPVVAAEDDDEEEITAPIASTSVDDLEADEVAELTETAPSSIEDVIEDNTEAGHVEPDREEEPSSNDLGGSQTFKDLGGSQTSGGTGGDTSLSDLDLLASEAETEAHVRDSPGAKQDSSDTNNLTGNINQDKPFSNVTESARVRQLAAKFADKMLDVAGVNNKDRNPTIKKLATNFDESGHTTPLSGAANAAGKATSSNLPASARVKMLAAQFTENKAVITGGASKAASGKKGAMVGPNASGEHGAIEEELDKRGTAGGKRTSIHKKNYEDRVDADKGATATKYQPSRDDDSFSLDGSFSSLSGATGNASMSGLPDSAARVKMLASQFGGSVTAGSARGGLDSEDDDDGSVSSSTGNASFSELPESAARVKMLASQFGGSVSAGSRGGLDNGKRYGQAAATAPYASRYR